MCAVKSSFHSVKPILTDGRKSASVDDLRTKGYVVPYSCRPPVASISKNLGRLIFCQVCGHIIEIPLSYSRLVVLCSNCRESTPARPPPSDRRFFRCCCGRLILVPVYVRSVICPRPGCRQLLLLPAATAMEYSELTRNQSVQTQSPSESRGDLELEIGPSQKHDTTEGTRPIELRCGFCYYRFFAPNSFGLTSDAKCPHCKHVTSVGPDFARIRALRLLEYALVALAVAIVTSVVTYVYRERTGGLYSVNLEPVYFEMIWRPANHPQAKVVYCDVNGTMIKVYATQLNEPQFKSRPVEEYTQQWAPAKAKLE